MDDRLINPWIAAAILIAIIAFAAVKVFWGVAQWTRKPQFRIGDRWGEEHVEVVEWKDGAGMVSAGGELWRATSSDPLHPGERVYVKKSKGLTLDVRKG